MICPSYDDLLGKRYADYADGPHRWNCWGIVREMHRRAGMELPDLNSVYRGATHPRLGVAVLEEAARHCESVEIPESGIIVILRVNRLPRHLGFMIDRTRFIHVLEDPAIPGITDVVVVQTLESPQWARKIEGFRRWTK